MKTKIICGILCLLIGIGLLICGFYGKYRMEEARKEIASTSTESIIPKNPITDPITDPIEKSIKEKYYRQVDQYELPVMLCYMGGSIFLVVGIFLLAFGRQSKK